MAETSVPFWKGLFDRIWSVKEAAATPITSSLELWREIYGGRQSRSGVSVTTKRALEVATVLACCRVLAEGVSQVPWQVYQQQGRKKSVAIDHPVHRLIYRRPNRWQTSFEFRETVMFHAVLTGNAFVFVNRVGSERRIYELVPIEPGRVTVKRDTETLRLSYEIRAEDNNGVKRTFPQETIWHIRGPSWNTWTGMEATNFARDAIGLSIALEDKQADYHRNGAAMSGVLSLKENIGQEAYADLAAWIDQHLPGGPRFQKPLVVDHDATYKSLEMSGVDAQHLETRKHQVEEICRAFRVMPIMIGQSDKAATYASAEQMFISHVVHSLMPWFERFEQSADINLLTEAELDQGFYTKFTAQALMRGSSKERAEYFAKALGSGNVKGWLTQNEVRELEEFDIDNDPAADELPQPPKSPSGDSGGQSSSTDPDDQPEGDD